MSNKALEFEDFILDDYDFNVYTDWDLMDLWEWVELDDFSDLERQSYAPPPRQYTPPPPAAPPPPSHAPPASAAASSHAPPASAAASSHAPPASAAASSHAPPASAAASSHAPPASAAAEPASPNHTPPDEDNIKPDVTGIMDELGLNMPPDGMPSGGMSQDHAADMSDDLLADMTAPDDNFDFDADFDSDFDMDFNSDIPSDNDVQIPIEAPINTNTDSNPPPPIQNTSQPIDNLEDDDFDLDFDFDFDDNTPEEGQSTQADPAPINTASDDDDFDFDFDFDDDTPEEGQSTQADPAPVNTASDDDFDFDFSFDDDDNTDFQDFETSDSLDLDMTTETDNLDENDYDFDLGQDNNGFGAGGYAPDTPEAPPPPAEKSLDTLTEDGHLRYIETSAGIMDIETDNILPFLQQLDFDEFLETLQLHGHVYDRIMASDKWSQEELEFLRSIEPLVKDEEKIAQIREQKAKEAEEAKNRMPETLGYEGKDKSHYDPRACASLQDMQSLLKEKALNNTLGQKRTVTHMPKKLVAEWSKDTHHKKSSRVGKNFSRNLKPIQEKKQKPWLKYVPHLPTIKTGKHERYYDELSTIINTELHAMCGNLDKDSINFIKEDGERFGNQFTEFLLGKYGTKILFLYRSQMENDILADKMFEDFHTLFTSNFSPIETEDYTQNFFRAILSHMKIHNIKI